MEEIVSSSKKTMTTKEIIKLILRVLVGVMFITTAIMKLFSLDEFELYIYSFEILNFVTVTIFARLLIAFEFLIGVFLIAKIQYKYTWWLTMLTMIGFTLFLIYAAIFRNDSNCHCFGDFIELNPVSSIVKNLITIGILLLIKNEEDYQFQFKKWVAGIAVAIAVIVPFIVFPMDAVYNKFIGSNKEVNISAFGKMMQDTAIQRPDIEHGNYFMAFYLPGCQYCKLSIKKIHSIAERNDLDISRIKIMISGDEEHLRLFKEESQTENYSYYIISPFASMDIVYGQFPTFVYISDGEVIKATDFRGIDENELVEFLQ